MVTSSSRLLELQQIEAASLCLLPPTEAQTLGNLAQDYFWLPVVEMKRASLHASTSTLFFVLVSKLRHLNLDEDSSLQAVWWSSAQLWRNKLTSFINCSLLLLSQSPWIHGRRFPSLCSLQLGGALCCFRGRQLNCFFSHSVISYLISDFTLHHGDNPPCYNHLLSLGLSDKFYRPGSSSWDPLGGSIIQSCEPGSPSTHFHGAHGKHKACSYCIWKKWWGPSLAVFVLWRE